MATITTHIRYLVILCVSSLVGTIAYYCLRSGSQEFSIDFLLLWSSAHLLLNGQNCYDYSLLTSTQRTFSEFVTLKMNHFPWVLAFLLPILVFPWKASVALMAAFNTTQLASLIKNGRKLCAMRREEFPVLLFALSSAVPHRTCVCIWSSRAFYYRRNLYSAAPHSKKAGLFGRSFVVSYRDKATNALSSPHMDSLSKRDTP